MSLADVEEIAMKLSENERVQLAGVLLDSVSDDFMKHRPDELEQRDRELEEGTVKEISYEELIRRVEAERRG